MIETQEVRHARDVFLNAGKTVLVAVIAIVVVWIVFGGVPGTRSFVRWGDKVISVTTLPDPSETSK